MWEVEIKLRGDGEKLSPLLKEKGATLVGREIEEDHYFQHPDRDFRLTDEAFRIRFGGKRTFLTYKGPKEGAKGKVREEWESPISGPGPFLTLFDKLGFREGGRVRKTRETWQWRGALICLDQVEGLGDFIEIEVPAALDTARAEALRLARDLARDLGLDPKEEIRLSYLELLKADPP